MSDQPTTPPNALSTYVVLRRLRRTGDGPQEETYDFVSNVNTNSAEAAIKAAAKKGDGYEDGTYVAIPARSFKPVTLKTKTETRVVLETL